MKTNDFISGDRKIKVKDFRNGAVLRSSLIEIVDVDLSERITLGSGKGGCCYG